MRKVNNWVFFLASLSTLLFSSSVEGAYYDLYETLSPVKKHIDNLIVKAHERGYLDQDYTYDEELISILYLEESPSFSGAGEVNFELLDAEDLSKEVFLQGWGNSASTDPEPKTPEAIPFFSLSLLNEDKKNIRKLITTMSDKNIVQLFLDIKTMNKLGDKIRRVHPLRFIGFILSDPYLRM